MMDEARLQEIEARAARVVQQASERRDAATWDLEDALSEDVPALIAEVRRLRAWLDRIDRLTGEVEETCGWCEELRRYAQAALRGRGTDGPE